MSDLRLDAVAAAARAELRDRMDRREPEPDFLDVVIRASEIQAKSLGEEWFEDARALDAEADEAQEAGSELGSAPSTFEGIALFNSDARALLDSVLDRRRLAAIPPPPALGTLRTLRAGRRRWTWAAAAAAVFVTGVAGATSLAHSYFGSEAPSVSVVQAEDAAILPRSTGTAIPPLTHKVEVGAEVGPDPVPEPESQPAPESQPQAQPKSDRSPQSESPANDLENRLADLDRRAQSLWRAGELLLAKAEFKKIVLLGGRSAYAEQAYAELFAIAHRTGDASEEEGLWRTYLRRFPDGRYADSALAGVCRRAGDDAQNCWTRYLERHPTGAARAEAIRATSK